MIRQVLEAINEGTTEDMNATLERSGWKIVKTTPLLKNGYLDHWYGPYEGLEIVTLNQVVFSSSEYNVQNAWVMVRGDEPMALEGPADEDLPPVASYQVMVMPIESGRSVANSILRMVRRAAKEQGL